jgi:hypothetical protein
LHSFCSLALIWQFLSFARILTHLPLVGLTGWLLKSGAADYGFDSVGTTMGIGSGEPDNGVVITMEVLYFIFGLAVPLLLSVLLSIVWFAPMTSSQQKSLFVFLEVLHAWCALDVFCVSIIAALLEIQQFAAFIVGDACDSVNVVLATFFDEQLSGYDKCFDVVASLRSESTVIFAAAIMTFFVAIVSLHLVEIAIHERLSGRQ